MVAPNIRWLCVAGLAAMTLRAAAQNEPASMGMSSPFLSAIEGVSSQVPDVLTDYIQRADALITAGKLEEASAVIQEALDISPQHPALLVRAGHVFTARRRLLIAEDYWAQLAEILPTNAWAQACWGGLLFRVRRFDEAQEVLARARALDEDELTARYNLAGVQLATEGRVRAGVLDDLGSTDIGRLATWAKDDSDVLAELLGEEGYLALWNAAVRGETATGSVEQVRELFGSASRAVWQAVKARRTDNWKGTLSGLEKVRDLGSRSPAVLADIELCRFEIGEKQEAIEAIGRLADAHPLDAHVELVQALFSLEGGEYEKAMNVLVSARRARPRDPEIALYFAAALAVTGRMDEARPIVRELVTRYADVARRQIAERKPYFKPIQMDPVLAPLLRLPPGPPARPTPAE